VKEVAARREGSPQGCGEAGEGWGERDWDEIVRL